MKNITSKTIVFFTGAFVSHSSWDQWNDYFRSKGYAPPWPYKDVTAAELRKRQPNVTQISRL